MQTPKKVNVNLLFSNILRIRHLLNQKKQITASDFLKYQAGIMPPEAEGI